jgi:hypothetical protein
MMMMMMMNTMSQTTITFHPKICSTHDACKAQGSSNFLGLFYVKGLDID